MKISEMKRVAIFKNGGRTALILRLSLPRVTAEEGDSEIASERINAFYSEVAQKVVSCLEAYTARLFEKSEPPVRPLVAAVSFEQLGEGAHLVKKRRRILKKSKSTAPTDIVTTSKTSKAADPAESDAHTDALNKSALSVRSPLAFRRIHTVPTEGASSRYEFADVFDISNGYILK